MKLSTRVRYSTMLMIDLTINHGDGPSTLKEIAKRQHLSERYLSNLTRALKVAGLVVTLRGARGGYTLGKKPSKISLKDIVEAVEGPIILSRCCERYQTCLCNKAWQELSDKMSAFLASVSLETLVK